MPIQRLELHPTLSVQILTILNILLELDNFASTNNPNNLNILPKQASVSRPFGIFLAKASLFHTRMMLNAF